MRCFFKNLVVFSLFMALFLCFSCNRHGCPGIDKKTGEFKVKKKQKTKSGLFPK